MTPAELKEKIESLPGSLGEAVEVTAKSALVKECLGDHVFEKFVENKRIEWDEFRIHVSQWELDRYLSIL
jgi:glutamine synthetase